MEHYDVGTSTVLLIVTLRLLHCWRSIIGSDKQDVSSQEEFNLLLLILAKTIQNRNKFRIISANGTGIILNVHITTHHAGTFLCFVMQHICPTPSFVRMTGRVPSFYKNRI